MASLIGIVDFMRTFSLVEWLGQYFMRAFLLVEWLVEGQFLGPPRAPRQKFVKGGWNKYGEIQNG